MRSKVLSEFKKRVEELQRYMVTSQYSSVGYRNKKYNLIDFIESNAITKEEMFFISTGLESCCDKINIINVGRTETTRWADGTKVNGTSTSWCSNCGSVIKLDGSNEWSIIKPEVHHD